MPSLKGLACVSLLTLAVVSPAVAQPGGSNQPSTQVPTISPNGSMATPGDRQNAPKTRKHRHRSRGTSAPPSQSQSGTSQ